MRCKYSQKREKAGKLGISNSKAHRSVYPKRLNKRAQVWVETVIYTLIGIAVIGIVLGISKPKIDEKKDEIIIEQALTSLSVIHEKIQEVQIATGNRRSIDLKIGKGTLIIDMDKDEIRWDIESSFAYSEENTPVTLGNINVLTKQKNPWIVTLNTSYNIELAYATTNEILNKGTKEINEAATPYKITIENDGLWKNEETQEEKTRIIIQET